MTATAPTVIGSTIVVSIAAAAGAWLGSMIGSLIAEQILCISFGAMIGGSKAIAMLADLDASIRRAQAMCRSR